MTHSVYPPSPPPSQDRKSSDAEQMISYENAVHAGNVFMCLPRSIRNRFYEYALLDTELNFGDVPDHRDFKYPEICEVDNIFYTEACQVIIKDTTFTLSSDAAIFNLMVFLNEFKNNEGYDGVQHVEFTSLNLFEKDVFSSNAAKLLRRCPNIKSISLLINLDHLIWNDDRRGLELDLHTMARSFDLKVIPGMGDLETVNLDLEPSMALRKKLALMEIARQEYSGMEGMKAGLEVFWGLKDWMEMEALNHGRLITVNCPKVSQFFPKRVNTPASSFDSSNSE
ncbi:hypothetical protein CC78DRAFT_545163 [Lojkania enalia]|uniref:Uncharacterized protein n=1 Tax=Lojkania enalia TaxID=147567 RepID=A0A9P4K6W7_9PLEO|nr:hypothetical protein CC78DRAFT_545163 [Didymosphaeria enalia]